MNLYLFCILSQISFSFNWLYIFSKNRYPTLNLLLILESIIFLLFFLIVIISFLQCSSLYFLDELIGSPIIKYLEKNDNIKKNTKSNIYAILNFDYVHPFNNSIRGDQNEQ